IHDNLYRVDDAMRNDGRAADVFLKILSSIGNAAPVLRSMRDSGFLGTYIPAFKNIEGLVPNNPLHEYTVDEHTLFAIAAIDRLVYETDGTGLTRHKILEDLPHPEVLMLAVLLHDAGKGRGGTHSERGAVVVPQITEQLGLPENLARQVVFLVSNHLLLETIARTRDINDEKILNDVAEITGSAEMLDYLYLLSYADVSSVGAGAWPAWKDALLHELYTKSRILLSEGRMRVPAEKDFREALLDILPEGVLRENAMLHASLVPARYRLEVSPEEAVGHLKLIGKLVGEGLPAVVAWETENGSGSIWVVSMDRPGRVAEIAGSISASSLAIAGATAYTRRDGIILDKFVAAVPAGSLLVSPWETAEKNIVAVLGGEISVEELMARRRKTFAGAASGGTESETVVSIDNRASDRYTVVDVACPDRLGLLYDLTRTILVNGMDIHFARITTVGATATDVFYVTHAGGGKITDEEVMEKLWMDITRAARGGNG
ncbi:MAG TPA: HD domain-containing protein, partial [Planctomycetes bacterium]|nr:HD domain-containing protein [Planctomycetota bacterium]